MESLPIRLLTLVALVLSLVACIPIVGHLPDEDATTVEEVLAGLPDLDVQLPPGLGDPVEGAGGASLSPAAIGDASPIPTTANPFKGAGWAELTEAGMDPLFGIYYDTLREMATAGSH
jgi:hypothetical protein